jgi:type IV secretion system protein VirD4
VGRLADRELSGVLSTASRGLRLYLDPLVARMTNTSSFTWQDLRERTRPMTLYLSVPYSDQQRLRPLSRLLIRQLLGYTTQHLPGWRHRLLGVIDEVQALNRLQALSEALNYAAGYGVTLCLITPSLHELDRLYGQNNNFLEGCHVRVAYAPNDFTIAQRFSRQTGEMEAQKVRQSWSQDVGSLLGRKTTSAEVERKPLLSPTGLMQLHKEQVLLLVGNMPPAMLTKARYWKHRLWRRRSQIKAPGGLVDAS